MSGISVEDARELRVLLHDAEAFIDARHTDKATGSDVCEACGLVARLRTMLAKL